MRISALKRQIFVLFLNIKYLPPQIFYQEIEMILKCVIFDFLSCNLEEK
jgi:hypothetical protein